MSLHQRKMQKPESLPGGDPSTLGRGDSAYSSNGPDTNGDYSTFPSSDSLPEKLVVAWAELPEWMQDNIFIHAGYRPENFSYRKCLKSLLYLHNEWVNIWSHLAGAIGFIALIFVTEVILLEPLSDTLQWTDVAVFYIFLAGAILCLSFSASFHTFMCHSETASGMWNRCDYVGIVCLILGSFFPAVYYGFYCHEVLQIVYLSGISIIGGATIVVTMLKRFRTPQFRWTRTLLFLSMGLSGVAPTVHAVYLYGFTQALNQMSLGYLLAMGAFYVTGALIYGHRIPERWYPGKFDIWFASHQIFHLFVVIACILHYVGMMQAMRYWHSKEGQASC